MNFLKKLDKRLISIVSKAVMSWRKKQKIPKHKYDFQIQLLTWKLMAWMLNLMFIIFLGVEHKAHGLLLSTSILAALVAIGSTVEYKLALKKKEGYDLIFDNRANPEIYSLVKDLAELRQRRDIKIRIICTTIDMIMLIFNILVLNFLLIPIFLLNIPANYIDCIFDMDEPPKKKQKQKVALTDLIAGRWRELVGSLSPQPHGTS